MVVMKMFFHLGDDDDGQESEGKIRQHILEGKRENTLVLRLASKEQELQDCLVCLIDQYTRLHLKGFLIC